jgi:hypothetical protein
MCFLQAQTPLAASRARTTGTGAFGSDQQSFRPTGRKLIHKNSKMEEPAYDAAEFASDMA